MSYIKTPSDLKYCVEATGSHFFDRESMKFFGDTMRNYGLRRIKAVTRSGVQVEVFELYRKRPVKGGLQKSIYFNVDTHRREFIDDTVQP